jgi:hypothetical protein
VPNRDVMTQDRTAATQLQIDPQPH